MHTLNNWSARRSGPQMTVTGYAPDDRFLERRLKFSVVEIQGPCTGRMISPASSIGVQRNGDVIVLAGGYNVPPSRTGQPLPR